MSKEYLGERRGFLLRNGNTIKYRPTNRPPFINYLLYALLYPCASKGIFIVSTRDCLLVEGHFYRFNSFLILDLIADIIGNIVSGFYMPSLAKRRVLPWIMAYMNYPRAKGPSLIPLRYKGQPALSACCMHSYAFGLDMKRHEWKRRTEIIAKTNI